MATITFTIPNAALLMLDAWARDKGYTDWRAFVASVMRAKAKDIQREQNRTDAQTLVLQDPNEPNIT